MQTRRARARPRHEWEEGCLANVFCPSFAPQYARMIAKYETNNTGTEASMWETARLDMERGGIWFPFSWLR